VDAAGRPTRSDRTSIDLHIAGREDESGGINVAQLVPEKSRLGNVQRYKLARPEMNTVEYRSVRSYLLRATTTRKRSGGNYCDCRAFITQRENGIVRVASPARKGEDAINRFEIKALMSILDHLVSAIFTSIYLESDYHHCQEILFLLPSVFPSFRHRFHSV